MNEEIRRQQGDLLLELHELNREKASYESRRKSFFSDLTRLYNYMNPEYTRRGEFDLELLSGDSYPEKYKFEELESKKAELARRSKDLENRKRELGL